MKQTFLLALILCATLSFGQFYKVDIIEYSISGKKVSEKERAFVEIEADYIDIFNLNEYMSHGLPHKALLVNLDSKSKYYEVQLDSNAFKDYQRKYGYKYDSLGRLSNFIYTSCQACSDMAFQFTFIYDKNGRIKRMVNTINTMDEYEFFYKNESLKKVKVSAHGVRSEKIKIKKVNSIK